MQHDCDMEGHFADTIVACGNHAPTDVDSLLADWRSARTSEERWRAECRLWVEASFHGGILRVGEALVIAQSAIEDDTIHRWIGVAEPIA